MSDLIILKPGNLFELMSENKTILYNKEKSFYLEIVLSDVGILYLTKYFNKNDKKKYEYQFKIEDINLYGTLDGEF